MCRGHRLNTGGRRGVLTAGAKPKAVWRNAYSRAYNRQAILIELRNNKYFDWNQKFGQWWQKNLQTSLQFWYYQLIELNWRIWLSEWMKKKCCTSRQFKIIKLKHHKYFWLKQKTRFMIIKKLETIFTIWY